MVNITIIKGRNLYMNGIATILREEMNEHEINLYNFHELKNFKKKLLSYPDLLIVEVASDIDVFGILNNFKDTGVKMAILTTSDISKKSLIELFQLNIDGYFYYQMELSELKSGIQMILGNGKYIHPYFSSIILEKYLDTINKKSMRPMRLLTNREWEVLEEMVNGSHNAEIAQRLNISEKTVKNHVASILKKLRVKDRTNAVVTAIKNNWVNV